MMAKKTLTILTYLLFLVAVEYRTELLEKYNTFNAQSTQAKIIKEIKNNVAKEPLVLAKIEGIKH